MDYEICRARHTAAPGGGWNAEDVTGLGRATTGSSTTRNSTAGIRETSFDERRDRDRAERVPERGGRGVSR